MGEVSKFINELDVKLKKYFENNNGYMIITLDEIDSGLSAENINMFLHLIIDITKKYEKVMFFIATNHYHFVYVYKEVLDMYSGKYIKIESYDEYYDLLQKGIMKMSKSRKREFNFFY